MDDEQLHDYYTLCNELLAYKNLTFDTDNQVPIEILNDYRFKVERMQRDMEYEILKYSIEALKPDTITEPLRLKEMEDLRASIMRLWV